MLICGPRRIERMLASVSPCSGGHPKGSSQKPDVLSTFSAGGLSAPRASLHFTRLEISYHRDIELSSPAYGQIVIANSSVRD